MYMLNVHVGCTRCVTSTTDHTMKMRARVVACIQSFDLFLERVTAMKSTIKDSRYGLTDLIAFQVLLRPLLPLLPPLPPRPRR